MSLVFFDVDTQLDFVSPSGALYAPGAELIVPAVSRLNRYASSHGIPLVSTADAHAENDPEFASWPPHCVLGTLGQRKPESTLVGQRILTKQSTDCFTVPGLHALLDEIGGDGYVVYGVVTEVCVRHAALGLLKTGRPVHLVTDAIKELSPDAASAFFTEFTALGGTLLTCAAIGA